MRLFVVFALLLSSLANAQEARRADLSASPACAARANLAARLTEARAKGIMKAEALQHLSPSEAKADLPAVQTEELASILESVYTFSNSRLSAPAMGAHQFLSCHYKTDAQITGLLARLAIQCQAQHSRFEPILRCAESVMLGLPLL